MKRIFLSLPICLVVGMAGSAAAQTAAKDFMTISRYDQVLAIFRAVMSAPERAFRTGARR